MRVRVRVTVRVRVRVRARVRVRVTVVQPPHMPTTCFCTTFAERKKTICFF